VSYILIKAAGLPDTQISVAATPPAMQPPFFISPGIAQTAATLNLNWFGPASLVASPVVTGPWTNAVSTNNSYAIPKSNLQPSEFYRLLYSQ